MGGGGRFGVLVLLDVDIVQFGVVDGAAEEAEHLLAGPFENREEGTDEGRLSRARAAGALTGPDYGRGRGVDRNYGYLGGECNQWYPDLVEDNRSEVHQLRLPVSLISPELIAASVALTTHRSTCGMSW